MIFLRMCIPFINLQSVIQKTGRAFPSLGIEFIWKSTLEYTHFEALYVGVRKTKVNIDRRLVLC